MVEMTSDPMQETFQENSWKESSTRSHVETSDLSSDTPTTPLVHEGCDGADDVGLNGPRSKYMHAVIVETVKSARMEKKVGYSTDDLTIPHNVRGSR